MDQRGLLTSPVGLGRRTIHAGKGRPLTYWMQSPRKVHARSFKARLIQEGMLENRCTECGQDSTWNGKHLVMQLDHIDGDRLNNLLDNLRLLCPNCHSQTPTFAGRNRARDDLGSVSE